MIIWSILCLLLLLIGWLLFTPLVLRLDSEQGVYDVRWAGMRVRPILDDQGPGLRFTAPFIRKEVRFTAAPTSKAPVAPGPNARRTVDRSRSLSVHARRFVPRLLRSFRVQRFRLVVDTDDVLHALDLPWYCPFALAMHREETHDRPLPHHPTAAHVRLKRMRQLFWFFLLAYSISWLIWAPLWLPALGIHGLPVLPMNHALGGLGPLLAAVICTAALKGRAGLELVGRNVFTLRAPLLLLVALLSPFVLAALSIALSAILHGTELTFGGLLRNKEFPQWSLAVLFAYNLLFFGFGEEVGWRGFALPRFQRTRNALWSSVLLALFWAAWHLPLFLYRPGYTSMDAAGAFGWLASLLTGSVLLTWLFNSTRGSMLAVAIFHATVDMPFTAELPDARVIGYLGMFITLWGIATVVVWKPRDLSKVPRTTAE